MASPLDLYSFVSGEYDAGRKQRDGNRLKALYQQALTDPSQNQRAIIGQVAGIDPSQAKGLYDFVNSRAEDQRKAVGQRAAMVRALPQEQRQAAYEGIRPDLDAAGLFAPEGADEGYLGAVAQTFGGLGSGASGVQSTYVDAAGNRVAIMRDGSTRTLGANDAGMSQQTIEVQGPDGRPLRYTFDKRTGNYVPMGAGQPQGGPMEGVQFESAPYTFDDPENMPPRVVAGIQAGEQAAGNRPWTANTPNPYGDATPRPRSIGVGQSPAEKAYAEQRAKTQAEIDTGSAVTRLEADRAAAKARAEAEAKAQAERVSELPSIIQTADETIGLLDQAINHPGRATVTGMSGTFDPRNYVPGTDATDFRVLLDQLGGRAFLQAFESLKGGGQITEVEGRKATEAMARLNTAQSDKAFKDALVELRGIAESAKRRAIQRASGQQQAMGGGSRGPVRVQTPADYDALPSGAIYISPDGQQRRKR